ncbi:MAG TPA: PQQ-binding-like beta-propeller repeat protein [Candidatus Limnocylindrales bacterium]|nr:PQQ-binding-like beta-propeller repeat protein [Candidatus Limnocylindrales bacterium]
MLSLLSMTTLAVCFAGCGKSGIGRQPAPATKWTLDVGSVYVPLAIGQAGAIYALTNSGELKAVGSGGGLLWSQPVASPDKVFGVGPAVGPDGTIYVLTAHSLTLYGPEGTLLKSWNLKNNEGTAFGIGLTRTRLYFQCGLFALCSWSLGPLWQPQWVIHNLSGRAAPLIHRDGQVVLSGDLLFELDGTSRVSDWFYPDSGYFTQDRFDPSGVEIRGGAAMHVIAAVAGPYGGTYALSPRGLLALTDKGKKLWEFETQPMDFQPVVATDGTVYLMSKKSELIAVQPDGKKAWAFSAVGQPGPPLLGGSGTIYCPVENKLYAIDPSGHEKWEAVLDSEVWGSMTLSSDGTLYAATRKGTLYAFPVGEGLMASPWPKFQGNVRNSGEEGVE